MQGWRQLVEQSLTGDAEARATLTGALGMVHSMPTLSSLASQGPTVPITKSSATPESRDVTSFMSNALPVSSPSKSDVSSLSSLLASSDPSSLLQVAQWLNTEFQRQQPLVPTASVVSPTLAVSNDFPGPVGLPALEGGMVGKDMRRGSGSSTSFAGLAPGAKTSSGLIHTANATVPSPPEAAVATATTATTIVTATASAAAAASVPSALAAATPVVVSTDTSVSIIRGSSSPKAAPSTAPMVAPKPLSFAQLAARPPSAVGMLRL